MTTPIPVFPAPDAGWKPDYEQALEFLFGRLNYERAPDAARSLQDFRLGRMVALLEELGNPQLSLPTVHIAGSKGKGSTATMVARIAEAQGCRVGLFTSPHLTRFEERITVNGRLPTEDEIVSLVEELRPAVARLERLACGPPTFFELSTALGWMHFARSRVDLAVMEVGLGGRLDSTNVCAPLVTAITSISRDHTRLLGDTLELIAREKAGIIKPGVPIISGVLNPGPAEVIASIADEREAPLWQLGEHFSALTHPAADRESLVPPCLSFDYTGPDLQLNGLQLAMPGEHQVRNAAVAISMTKILSRSGFPLDPGVVRRGLAEARCPVRVEVVSRDPLIVVDAAHNPASMEALCQALAPVRAGKRLFIFATSRDKECAELLRILNRHADEIILTQYTTNPRALDLLEMERLAGTTLTVPWRTASQPSEALALAKERTGQGDLICLTGSFFLAAEAKQCLQDSPLPSLEREFT